MMTDNGSLDTIMQFKQSAEKSFELGDVEEAFKNYLVCLRLYPEWKEDLKEKFVLVLCAYGEMLEEKQEFDGLFTCYEDALEVYCDSAEILCNLGAHLCRLGFHMKAYYYFLEALRQNEKYLPAYKNIQNTCSYIVERWHFRMLNDSIRNESFEKAVSKKVSQKFNTVLDIGTGTGLLSIFAVRSGAIKVYGCDYNKEMISIAQEVIKENVIDDKITLIDKLSNHIEIPIDMQRRVSLVVTETMDSGLLGEHLLRTLAHAWDNLLLPPYPNSSNSLVIENDEKHGIVIPFGGSLYIAGVESRTFAKRYYYPLTDLFTDECIDVLQCISIKDSKFLPFNSISLSPLKLRAEMDDPYDTERLKKSAYKFLTDPQELFYINFNDPDCIKQHLNGQLSSAVFNLTCTTSGYLYALAAWFNVKLDEDIVLSSSPLDSAETTCWDQAMFPLQKPIPLIPGCVLTVAGTWRDGKVSLELKNCTFPTNNSKVETSPVDNEYVTVPQQVVCILNDYTLLQRLHDAASYFVDKIPESATSLYVLDLFPVPIFGLNVLHNSHLTSVPKCSVKIACLVESENVKECIRLCASANSINPENIEFLNQESLDKLCSEGRPTFDAILTNFIDQTGDMNDSAVIQTTVLRYILKEGGLLFPCEVKLCGQVIESNWLKIASRVVDRNVEQVNITPVINRFKVSHHVDLDLFTMEYKALSDPFISAVLRFDQLNEQLETSLEVPIMVDGSLTAVSYWFEVDFVPGCQYSTLTDHSYASQAAFLLSNEIPVKAGNTVKVTCLYQRGMFRMVVNDDMSW